MALRRCKAGSLPFTFSLGHAANPEALTWTKRADGETFEEVARRERW